MEVKFVNSEKEFFDFLRSLLKSAAELEEKSPYDSEIDIQWLTGSGQKIAMKPDMFYIVYPTDAHKPCCHESRKTSYRKAVVKIRIDRLLHGVSDRQVPWQRR